MSEDRPRRRGNWSVQELERLKHLLPRRGVDDTAILLRRSADSVRRKALELFRSGSRRTAWTADEDLDLRRSHGALEPRLLAVVLRRPLQDVLARIETLRRQLRKGPWTRQDVRMLKEYYGTRTDEELEICLLRPREEIQQRAAEMCLQKDKRFHKARTAERQSMPRWTEAEIRRLAELYPTHPNLEVARLLGRSVASVANKANHLGLKKTSELLADIGRTNVSIRYRSGSGDDAAGSERGAAEDP